MIIINKINKMIILNKIIQNKDLILIKMIFNKLNKANKIKIY